MFTVTYESLDIEAKVNCMNEYINKVCPYEDWEGCEIEDVEYSIKAILEEMKYLIDTEGYWYSVDRI